MNKTWLNSNIFLKHFLCAGVAFSAAFSGAAQSNVAIGSWRVHLSYNSLVDVALDDNRAFGATQSGILVLDRSGDELTTYNTLSGLSATGITSIAYDRTTDQLWVGYEDSNVDVIHENEVTNFSRLRDLSTLTGSKRINHIAFRDHLAYVSTDYGIVIFDQQAIELKETWRDLGASGEKIKVFQTAFYGDSIVAATEKGVIIGSLYDNLLDFNHWKHIDDGDLNTEVQAVAVFNTTVFAAIDGAGIYRYSNGSFIRELFLQNADFNSLRASGSNLVITEADRLWLLDETNNLIQVADDAITQPNVAAQYDDGSIWIADGRNGLVSNYKSEFISYTPNGPSHEKTFRLSYADKKMYALAGGFTSAGSALNNSGMLDVFHQGLWQQTNTALSDLTDVAFTNNSLFVSSFGKGLLRENDQSANTVFDENNSTLENRNISSIAISDAGLWVVNYGATNPLHLLKSDNTWQSFSVGNGVARYTNDIAVDFAGNIWMVVEPSRGGGIVVFDPSADNTTYLTTGTGSGALPNMSVRSIASDRDGTIWVGTDGGIAYFFSYQNDAVKPIFEDRFLLKDEKITAIEVDGGNRKWVGTENGAWLFSPTGEELVVHFTSENSPLLSDNILDIQIDDGSGEVFFATDKGTISYRGDATGATVDFQKIKIFPNPVSAEFAGTVGISGLATDAFVKITDVSGKLIWQTQANGGTATWNVRDYDGRRAASGIYLVFAATEDGSESVVGKIAVIE